jgi:hypothetical protein
MPLALLLVQRTPTAHTCVQNVPYSVSSSDYAVLHGVMIDDSVVALWSYYPDVCPGGAEENREEGRPG